MSRTLEQVAATASTCTLCRLSSGRTQVVFGDGSPTADLMFIGEGPGYHEDVQGLPFVGAAGQLLNRLLGEIGLRREDVYIANVVKCLRYNAMVQLADGSWERIGRLVRMGYGGRVMSVDASGELVPRRVIGWHESPLAGRRVFRLTYRSAKRAGPHQVAIQLTGDHPVLTEAGYVPVQDLPAGARIATGQGLSETAYEVMLGTLLGDGHIGSGSAYLVFSHTARHQEYARFKADLLTELRPRTARMVVAAVVGGERAYEVVRVRTLAHRALRAMREVFYRPQKTIPTWLPDQLSARMLAIWFMDDGHLRIRPPRQPTAEIATNAFEAKDLALLGRGLERLGMETTTRAGRLQFGVTATRVLSELIAPFVPPIMRYKLHPELERQHPFEPGRWEVGRPRTLYDEAVVEEVTHQSRSDTTFFCIDVEDTGNFVTSAGVVHNCRPPGNRDPLPDEIASCTPYLRDQIALIDPRILITLGNFATRFILDRQVAISRVRGQEHPWEGRIVVPTFHPAAALRGGGEGSPTMTALRQDFALVRRLLDEAPSPAPVEEQLGLF